MLDTSQLEEARRALEMVVGADRVARDIREVRTVQGLYSMTQLSQWYQSLTMSYIKGTFSTDLSEGDNRINFGVVDQDAKARVEAEIDRLGMPREAVGFQIDPDPIKRHSDTLDSQFDPLVGGPRIDFLASGVFSFVFH